MADLVSGVRGGRSVDPHAEAARLSRQFAVSDRTDLGGTVVRLRRLIDQLEGLWLVAVLDVEESGVRLEDGAASLAGWLRVRARLAPGEAQAKAKLAWALVEQLPLTQAAIAEGRIGVRHAQVIDQVVRQVPAQQRPGVEAVLVPAAGELDPLQLKRLGAEVVYRLDTEAVDAAAVRRYERRGLSVAATLDGLVHLNGLLDPVAGATVMTAIDALVAPSRVSLDDPRSGPQRRADALTQLCQTFLDAGAADAAGAPARPDGSADADPPDRAQLRGGVRPHLSVIIDLATLGAQPGHPMAELGWVGPVTARQARLIACDAVVSRVVMVSAPGCHAPPQHCDAHHIVFWEDGGPTSVDNCVLLCRHHHHSVHLRGWTVTTDPDGSKHLSRDLVDLHRGSVKACR